MKKFFIRWLPVYAPLSLLAAGSFQLPESPPPSPAYLAAFEGAQYWSGGAAEDGVLQISAARMEQRNAEVIDMFDLRMSQARGSGGVVLEGARGEARRRGGGKRRLQIANAGGEIKSAGQSFSIRAEEIFYDADTAALSGSRPEISGVSVRLRGDKFMWGADGVLKVEGNVESVYGR